jgi:hypothetical protein
MSRFFSLRLALPVFLASALLPVTAVAQSQDSQSVAEAARKARAKKKNSEKPAKVITDDTLDVKKGDVQSAVAEEPRIPGSQETSAQPNAEGSANAPAQGPRNASDGEKVRTTLKERVALKEKIKDAQSDLDLLQREYQLDQDSYYSKVDYDKDTAGKDKLDAEKQQISEKQQELEKLKAQLAALPESQEPPAAAPPQS